MKSTQTIKKWLTLSLATWMLLVSTGFRLDQHYCQGVQKSFRFFTEAPNCHLKAKKCHAQTKDLCTNHQEEKPCCENKSIFLKLEGEWPELVIQAPDLVPFMPFLGFNKVQIFEVHTPYHLLIPLRNIRPPILRKNLKKVIFIQSFLC